MRPLILVAAGGLAREVVEAVRAADPGRAVRVVDDDPALLRSSLHGAPVVGGLYAVHELDDHEVVVCAGNGRTRRFLVDRLLAIGVEPSRFATIVHPSVEVPASCRIGAGSVLLAQVALTSDVRIGDHVVVMPQVTLTHDVVVEDYATLCAGVSLGGGVRVGAAAYVGMNATARQAVALGSGSTLGMGAALLQDLPVGETWAGVPAVPIGAPRLQEV
ncbi:acetyltransferase [Nocardioides sp. Root1257]|uniref:NeuD/PglB/VioB family sugar acetyltransferase n=1 Tax=unclassified Nocardioides TaxID=2615069 RepID=UPI000701C1EA|nr:MULTISPECIES: NeuD/PglB/VioB family sugar acetyltransferase [unclassified Nocardioides]KQW48829.1 acetyltransferase [Nocardioides sp. Root1257]KRC48004.1 acetyltransferase [Nocardioides sp. Root224]